MTTHPVRPPEWIDAAPIRVERSVDIAAPPSEVWVHIADHVAWPEWFTALDRVEVVGEPTGVGGGRRVFVRSLSIDEEFTAWDVEQHFAFAVIGSKLPILDALAESVRLEPTPTGTRVTYRQGVAARRGFDWVMRQLWKRPARQLGEALEALRTRVEGVT